ncbi:MAG: bacillithiol transferase BstA [Ignavibacteria bacterium]
MDYNLRYPIGEFQKPEVITDKILNDYISVIENFPAKIRVETEHLTDSQLDTQYRPEGWTIRQVVNHCADSHMNSLMRFKLALTEVEPAIRPYFEDRWAELADSKSISIEPALKMLEGIHLRWTVLLKSLTKQQLNKNFIHPEHGKNFRLDENIGIYAWHCDHHLAHITSLKKKMKWLTD